MHLPPPIHGASVMGKVIFDSFQIRDHFECKFINMSAAKNVEEVGHVNFRKLIFMITNSIDVLKVVRDFQPDICYMTPSSWGWGFYRIFPLVQYLKSKRVSLVLHFHNKAHRSWLRKSYNQWLLKRFYKNVKIILLGKELYAEKAPYISENEVRYIPNGIPSKVGTPIVRSWASSKPTRFLFLSNMLEEKGVYILLKACQLLHQQNHAFQCDFVGEFKDVTRADFDKRVKAFDLEKKVKAHGAKYRADKSIFLTNADVFVFPTYYQDECLPLVLLEAMDYSLPCISTVNGAIPSVINEGKTGYCIPQKNVAQLADRMIWMIKNPEARIRMGENGKKRFVENYRVEQFEDRLAVFLDTIKQ